jgi:hypothetical protein
MFLDQAIEQGLDKEYRIEHPNGFVVYKVCTKDSVFVKDLKSDPKNDRILRKVTTLLPLPYLIYVESNGISRLVDKKDLLALNLYSDWTIPELHPQETLDERT